ncbi:tumor necrosis factor receptor superfamily member 6-like [Lethenteron reissneri]|uniref:tumor necrosis factor receptor superfamily member 6-like n=1 Tax=Lethenteron reissneri TaxID=7753 RepID=UPI002AB7269E|nr:tumor necrosis factor receptor superfamily member 6-like [Lethenteron reissneri]
MQPKQLAALGLISGIIFLKFISMAEHNECEDKGQYRAANGFCCHLCLPGSRWLYDCFNNGDQSVCTSCISGKDYMDVANRDLQCKKCSTCNLLYEDFQQDCTVTSNTVCQCKDGYSRPDPSQPCEVTSNTEKHITIPFVIGTLILLVVVVVVVVAVLIYRKKKCLYPFDDSGKVTETVPLLLLEVPKAVLKLNAPQLLIGTRHIKNLTSQMMARQRNGSRELQINLITQIGSNTGHRCCPLRVSLKDATSGW